MSWWLVGAAAVSAVYGAYNDHKGNRQDARNGYGLAAILGSAAGGSALMGGAGGAGAAGSSGGAAAGGEGAAAGGGLAGTGGMSAGGEASSGLLLDTSAGGWGGATTGSEVGGAAGSGSPAYMKLLGNALSSYGKGSQSGGAANQGSYNASGIPDLSQPAFVYNPQPDMKPYSIAPNQLTPDEQAQLQQKQMAQNSGLMAARLPYG